MIYKTLSYFINIFFSFYYYYVQPKENEKECSVCLIELSLPLRELYCFNKEFACKWPMICLFYTCHQPNHNNNFK